MLGALLKTALEAQARRAVLLDEAAGQRARMAAYLDAFDPASLWVERFFGAVKFVLARPVIPAGVLAALVILKPRRALKIAIWAWKAMSWLRRVRGALS
jgi:hypothetical protein